MCFFIKKNTYFFFLRIKKKTLRGGSFWCNTARRVLTFFLSKFELFVLTYRYRFQMNATTTEVLPEVEDFHNGGSQHPATTTTTSTQAPYYYYEPGANGTSYIWNNRGHDSIWLPEVKIPEEPTTKRRRMSTLTMVVNQESLRQGTLSLTCKASVFSLYSAQAELLLAAERPQIAPVVVLATGHTHSGEFG